MINLATGVTTTYMYDADGNRLTSVGSTSLSNDANGQITAYGSNTYTDRMIATFMSVIVDVWLAPKPSTFAQNRDNLCGGRSA